MRSIEQQTRGRETYTPVHTPAPQLAVRVAYRSGGMVPQQSGRYAPITPTTPPTCSIPVPMYGRNAAPRAPVPYGDVNVAPAGTGVIPLTSGVDLYNPTKAAALGGARCFCAMQGVSGKVIKCVDCDLAVHAKCHQLITVG